MASWSPRTRARQSAAAPRTATWPRSCRRFGAGANELQRNIMAQRGLGMPSASRRADERQVRRRGGTPGPRLRAPLRYSCVVPSFLRTPPSFLHPTVIPAPHRHSCVGHVFLRTPRHSCPPPSVLHPPSVLRPHRQSCTPPSVLPLTVIPAPHRQSCTPPSVLHPPSFPAPTVIPAPSPPVSPAPSPPFLHPTVIPAPHRQSCIPVIPALPPVIPAQAGIHAIAQRRLKPRSPRRRSQPLERGLTATPGPPNV